MKLYVDLDGVLVDFTKQLCKLLGKPLDRDFEPGNDTKVWKKIDEAGEDFWADMDWMPDGKELWESIKKYNPTILTAPSNHDSSIEGKKKWLTKNLPGVPFIIEQDKFKYAEPDAVLIDDREKNINPWDSKGGTGILHTSAEDTLNKIKKGTNMKKVCSSHIVRNVVRCILAGRHDDKFERFMKSLGKKPQEMGEFAPSYTKEKPGKSLFRGVHPKEKKLLLDTLTGLSNHLRKNPLGGKNREALLNLNKLLRSINDVRNTNLSQDQYEGARKDLLDKAYSVFPADHPKRELNLSIRSLLSRVLNKEYGPDIDDLVREIKFYKREEPKEQMNIERDKGFESYRDRVKRLKLASSMLKSLLKDLDKAING